MKMFNQFDTATIARDIPEYELKRGTRCVIVEVYEDHAAYEVECFNDDGKTIDVVTVFARDLDAA